MGVRPSRLVPVYINVRDRVTDLRTLVEWLERAGHERITLVDNASTYEPLIDYLKASPHEVLYIDQNVGARSLWELGIVPREPFVWTDPDVIPTEDCPLDVVDHLGELLKKYPHFPKAGLGLKLDDLPADLPSLTWERSLVSKDRLLEPGVYSSLIDTTFALCRPGVGFVYEAIRTGSPYLARHTSWYRHNKPLSEEERYYVEHARIDHHGSSWAQQLRRAS